MLNVSNFIQNQVNKCDPGRIIQLNDFKIPADNRMAMAKELSRLAQKGILCRLEKGKYFRPRQTAFGVLRPSEKEVINTILKSSKGYLSGAASFNSLGLTSQVANTIEISVSEFRPPKVIAGIKIKFRKSIIDITAENREVLQILDAVRHIKKIPGSMPDEALVVLIAKIRSMSHSQKQQLADYALRYNPSTRALTGAMFELNCAGISVSKLFKSLNPLSTYRLGILDEYLPNKLKWRIE